MSSTFLTIHDHQKQDKPSSSPPSHHHHHIITTITSSPLSPSLPQPRSFLTCQLHHRDLKQPWLKNSATLMKRTTLSRDYNQK
jgi:hypothetical protein